VEATERNPRREERLADPQRPALPASGTLAVRRDAGGTLRSGGPHLKAVFPPAGGRDPKEGGVCDKEGVSELTPAGTDGAIEGTCARARRTLHAEADGLWWPNSRPVLSLIALRQRSPPPKRRGKKLGGFRAGAKLTAKARQKGANTNAEAAAARAADLAPVITELQASGATSLRAIATALNDRGIPTARGSKWFAASVRDVLTRI
jgi:hypothetical protein